MRPESQRESVAADWDWSNGPPGPTWTVFRCGESLGEICGVAGGYDLGDGDMLAWAWIADLATREWPAALDLAETVIEFLRIGGARRVLAHARVGMPGAVECLQRLGFEAVGAQPIQMIGLAYQLMAREG